MLRAVAIFFFVGVALSIPDSQVLDQQWEQFKTKFNKQYTAEEEAVRKSTWLDRVAVINQHNLRSVLSDQSFYLRINKYADLTQEEFRKTMCGYRMREGPNKANHRFVAPKGSRPDTVDWRNKGMVTGIKDQMQCGSCWAFSAVGSLEGQHMKKTGNLVSLSEQNLVDCSGPQGNEGCNGGWMDSAFQYVIDNHGIDTEESYPYTGKDGTCKFDPAHIGANCTGFVDIPSGDEEALQAAVATVGPISVAIDASSFLFQFYWDGVYNDPFCSSTNLDHGVLVVGYGTENGKDYWLVKNSWGESWGMNGYIKMSRNKNNQCGIATQASYPLM